VTSAAAKNPLEVGQLVAARYKVVRRLGAGGMGVVYEAEHTLLGRSVALKVLLPELVGDAEVTARFMREARAAATTGHPGIVEVFDLGVDAGMVFLAMEKLEGEELSVRIKREAPLPHGWVARVGRDIADAVSAAHERGIVHRDLKPQNVFLAREGRNVDVVKILDFGIAKLAEADRADAPLTKTGAIFGTPLYMAPEQLRGVKDLDGRCDVYAIGAILYECLSGRPPFVAPSYPELILQITTEPPRPLSELAVAPSVPFAEVIERALAKRREDRFGSATALADALDGIGKLAREPDATRTGRRSVSLQSIARSSTVPASDPTLAEAVAATPFVSVSTAPRPPVRSRAPLAIGILLVVALGATAAALSLGGGEPEVATRTLPVTAMAATAMPATAAAAPTAQPAPSTARVHFESTPTGAEVRAGDRVLCTTPCDADVPADATLDVVASKDGREKTMRLAPPLPEEAVLELPRATRRTKRPVGEQTSAPGLPPLKGR
jgi:serine/threonine-protein kinase